jgi:hypothetical protein
MPLQSETVEKAPAWHLYFFPQILVTGPGLICSSPTVPILFGICTLLAFLGSLVPLCGCSQRPANALRRME